MYCNVVDLVVVLHELDDDPDVVAVVLDGDDPHDVGGVLSVGVGAVLVSKHQARVSLVYLPSQFIFTNHHTSISTSPLENYASKTLQLPKNSR